MRKKISKISVLVIIGMIGLIFIASTPSAVNYGPNIYSEQSYAVFIDYDNNATDDVFTIEHNGGQPYYGDSEELFRIQEDGKVGIKTSEPTNMLDVNGSVRVRDLPQDNTLNDIVVADANGVLHTRDVNSIGGFTFNIITVTDDYTPTDSDYTILVDASSNNVRIRLPPAADVPGQVLVLKRVDDNKTNKVIIDPDGSETIDGRLHIRLRVKFMSYTVQSDGFDWYIIASYGFMGRSHLNNSNR